MEKRQDGVHLADWIATLETEAQRRWDAGRNLLLVSQVPSVLTQAGIDVLEVRAGRPLLTVLQAEARDSLCCVQHPVHTAVWAALPKKVASTIDTQTVFDKPKSPKYAVEHIPGTTKYQPWFWAAFVKDLDPAKRRWLSRGNFRDEEANIEPTDGSIEILKSDVSFPGLGLPPDEAAVRETMAKWASKNSINLELFEVLNTAKEATSTRKHIVSLGLESLGSEDFSRILEFTGLGLKPFRGRYEIDKYYCEELLETMTRYIEGRPECVRQGLAVIIVQRAGQRPEETRRLEEAIWPFALSKTISIEYPVSDRGEGLKRAANIYSTAAISGGQSLASLTRYVNNVFTTQLRRTPLLLPLRRFDSTHLVSLIREVLALLPTSSEPADVIDQACERFLAVHPRRRDGKGAIFENNSGVEFKTPPRSRRGSRYSGNFKNCHDARGYYNGNPHLNIFPNDLYSMINSIGQKTKAAMILPPCYVDLM
jgi:hypothetical protein